MAGVLFLEVVCRPSVWLAHAQKFVHFSNGRV